jgi:hypothetical protein
MAKRRETIDTTRLTANLINPKPETDDHEVKAFPVSKPWAGRSPSPTSSTTWGRLGKGV